MGAVWCSWTGVQQEKKALCVSTYTLGQLQAVLSLCTSSEQAVRALKWPYERDPDLKANISPMLYQGNRQNNPQPLGFCSFKEANPFGKGSDGVLNQGRQFFCPYGFLGKWQPNWNILWERKDVDEFSTWVRVIIKKFCSNVLKTKNSSVGKLFGLVWVFVLFGFFFEIQGVF